MEEAQEIFCLQKKGGGGEKLVNITLRKSIVDWNLSDYLVVFILPELSWKAIQ